MNIFVYIRKNEKIYFFTLAYVFILAIFYDDIYIYGFNFFVISDCLKIFLTELIGIPIAVRCYEKTIYQKILPLIKNNRNK